MSGIDLLLRTAIDYERTHQIALFTLLSKSKLPDILLDIAMPKSIQWEPERQLFDLAVEDGTKSTYLELKMWSSLSASQFNGQVKFLLDKNFRGLYVLLGTSWYECTEKIIYDQ